MNKPVPNQKRQEKHEALKLSQYARSYAFVPKVIFCARSHNSMIFFSELRMGDDERTPLLGSPPQPRRSARESQAGEQVSKQTLRTRSLEALQSQTSKWQPFGLALLGPLCPSDVQAVWPTVNPKNLKRKRGAIVAKMSQSCGHFPQLP